MSLNNSPAAMPVLAFITRSLRAPTHCRAVIAPDMVPFSISISACQKGPVPAETALKLGASPVSAEVDELSSRTGAPIGHVGEEPPVWRSEVSTSPKTSRVTVHVPDPPTVPDVAVTFTVSAPIITYLPLAVDRPVMFGIVVQVTVVDPPVSAWSSPAPSFRSRPQVLSGVWHQCRSAGVQVLWSERTATQKAKGSRTVTPVASPPNPPR